MIWFVGWMYGCGMCLSALHLNNILQVRWHRWMKVAFWPLAVTYATTAAAAASFDSKG